MPPRTFGRMKLASRRLSRGPQPTDGRSAKRSSSCSRSPSSRAPPTRSCRSSRRRSRGARRLGEPELATCSPAARVSCSAWRRLPRLAPRSALARGSRRDRPGRAAASPRRFERPRVFAVVALGGIGIYLGAVALGVNRFVVPVPPIGHWWTVPVLLLNAAGAALLEEAIVLAYLVTRLRRLRGPRGRDGASALLRGTYHLYQGWGGFAGNLAMGLLFGWLFIRTRRAWPFVIGHFLLDVGAGVGFLLFRDRLARVLNAKRSSRLHDRGGGQPSMSPQREHDEGLRLSVRPRRAVRGLPAQGSCHAAHDRDGLRARAGSRPDGRAGGRGRSCSRRGAVGARARPRSRAHRPARHRRP